MILISPTPMLGLPMTSMPNSFGIPNRGAKGL